MEEKEEFIAKYKWQLVLGAVVIIAVIFASYFTFVKPISCTTYACFQENMASCNKATYINEDPEASWRYTIIGKESGECKIEVILLQAKKGDLELDLLKGYGMECIYPIGVVNYPDADLGACSGRLKEELQGIVIKKLYSYILDNLGQLDESLKSAI